MRREKKYQVFISSTYEDLKEERMAVSQTLLDLGCIPVSMEQFPASGMSQMEYIKKMLETCDYYILILAGRYGSIDPTDGIGYTEKEYDYAVSSKIPVMSFIAEDIGKLPAEKCESTESQREFLIQFRNKVSANKLIKKYSSKEDLQTKIAISLQQCIKDFPAAGWVRADSIDTELSTDKAIENYLKKHIVVVDENSSKMIEDSPVITATNLMAVSNAEEKILYLLKNGSMTRSEICAATGLSERTVSTALISLYEKGYIKEKQTTKGKKYYCS